MANEAVVTQQRSDVTAVGRVVGNAGDVTNAVVAGPQECRAQDRERLAG